MSLDEVRKNQNKLNRKKSMLMHMKDRCTFFERDFQKDELVILQNNVYTITIAANMSH